MADAGDSPESSPRIPSTTKKKIRKYTKKLTFLAQVIQNRFMVLLLLDFSLVTL